MDRHLDYFRNYDLTLKQISILITNYLEVNECILHNGCEKHCEIKSVLKKGNLRYNFEPFIISIFINI